MTTGDPRVFSDLPIPPGEVLAEEIEARGMTQRELAAKLGMPVQVIDGIILENEAITPDIAVGLSNALGIDASFWMNLESQYQAALAKKLSGSW